MIRFDRRTAVIFHDLSMVVAAWGLAFMLRYSIAYFAIDWHQFWVSLPIVITAQGMLLWWTGLYRGLWRFASLPDLWNIMRAAFIGVTVIGLLLFLYNRIEGVPRATLLMYPVLLVFLLGSPRLFYRLWKDYRINPKNIAHGRDTQRVLILGAGSAAEMLARDMRRAPEYQPVGFLDDNKQIRGAKIQGLPVFGDLDQLERVTLEQTIDLAVIAMPSLNNIQMQRVVTLCEDAKVSFRTLPKVEDLISGEAGLKTLRQVSIEDLLGRDPVLLDWREISQGIAGKVVVVTGGGGSIGSELCRQIARLGPAKLVILEQSEFNLYTIKMELRNSFPNLEVSLHLIDVCDNVALDHLFASQKPEVVFHAAAYKHVPMLETQVREAVRNNVLGSRAVALAADRHGAATVVMISTDKAVNPANVMGASKRAAEIFCQNLNRHSQTHYITVRFGNVLGSAGSVVPLFREQIEKGGPVTVTHPDITRYFMTIPESTQLIMQAAAMGSGGEIYVLEMGEPIKINYLAEQMIRLSGKIPGKDIEIIYTGLRPGEKLYEELFHDQECLTETRHEKILLAQSRHVDWSHIQSIMEEMEAACHNYDEPLCRLLLQKLVPEMEGQTSPMDNVVKLSRAKV
jgi:FlaA1/EpsC-like NDP-sugar epimerase